MPARRDLSQLEPLYDKKLRCPFCESPFTTKKVRSRFVKIVRIESDFCQVFDRDHWNPLHYYIAVCPQCAFAFTDEFSELIPARLRPVLQEELAKWRASHPENYSEQRTLSETIETYTWALQLADLLKEKNIVFAGLNLRRAWISRDQNDLANEKEYLQLAADFYEKSYIAGDFAETSMTEIQLLYMMGELRRRLGDHREAVRCFGKVVQHDDQSRYSKFVNMAREQWTLAVAEYKQKKKEAEEQLDEYEDVIKRGKK